MISTVDISRAEKIDGWMLSEELTWLAEQAANHRTIVEVGSYLGRSTRAMADNTSGRVVAIDTWNGPLDSTHQLVEEFFPKFAKNLEDLIISGKVIPCVPEEEAGLHLEPDMVFLDGDHSYVATKKDIMYWLPRIKRGGLLCGHDADCDDVRRAVLESIGEAPVVYPTRIWYRYV